MLQLSIRKLGSILRKSKGCFTSLQQPHHLELPPPKIKSLASLMEERKKENVKDLLQNGSEVIFQYGMDPMEFRLHCYTYFKYGFWQTHPRLQEKLIAFISKCDAEEKEFKGTSGSRLLLIQEYRRGIATQLLPSTIADYQYSNVYLNLLSSFLTATKQLSLSDITFITLNFDRILFGIDSLRQFVNDKDNAWIATHAFSLFLDHCVPMMASIPITLKSTIVSVARSLRIKHLPYLGWLKRDLQKEKKELNLQVFLSALIYLGHHNSFPYEYFYRNKHSLMAFIQAADALSEKKVTVSMYMLEIFARHRLACCERILSRLLTCIQQNLSASDVSQLARIFYHYSRLKCSVDHGFVASLIERLYLFLNVLETSDYLLIIKAVASLNYRDDLLLERLKGYNYELFLASLKFGCSSLGSYYQAVLDEVEISFASDPARHYRQDDEPFTETAPRPLQLA